MMTHVISRRRVGRHPPANLPVIVGLNAVVFSVLYFVSDVLEVAQGGFSTVQLGLTYAAEAAIPLFVIGLYAVQRPRIGRLGLIGAIGYAYAFVFFTGTVVVALVNHTRDWITLVDWMSPWVGIHGAVMVFAGVAFGVAVIRADVFPAWTGVALIAGVVLVALSSRLPDVAQAASAGVRDLAFGGMGASLLATRRGQPLRADGRPRALDDARSTHCVVAEARQRGNASSRSGGGGA